MADAKQTYKNQTEARELSESKFEDYLDMIKDKP